MIAGGAVVSPLLLPKPGETHWRQSCDREVRMVREAVGVVDVSTLGKIDIQGPDAAEFLDFVYCNMFSTLKPGRVRYGLMLREDGHVMDDGTTARLGEHHYRDDHHNRRRRAGDDASGIRASVPAGRTWTWR
jgi:glycine cleavage system aminomethyltransferase T